MLTIFRTETFAGDESAARKIIDFLSTQEARVILEQLEENGIGILGDAIRNYFSDDVIQSILDAGVNPDLPSPRRRRGLYPIHEALHRPNLLEKLIEAGAELEIRDNQGRTPLQAAEEDWTQPKGNFDPKAVLLEAGAMPVSLVRPLGQGGWEDLSTKTIEERRAERAARKILAKEKNPQPTRSGEKEKRSPTGLRKT